MGCAKGILFFNDLFATAQRAQKKAFRLNQKALPINIKLSKPSEVNSILYLDKTPIIEATKK